MTSPIRLTLDSLQQTPDPPFDLNAAGKTYWREVLEVRVLNPEALEILHEACRLRDRAAQAAAAVKRAGAYLTSTRGTVYPHPGIAVQRASIQTFERLRRALNLDSVPAKTEIKPHRRAAYK